MFKVLVIEDEKPIREILLELLKNHNYKAIGAENGRIGLQMALSEVPDLVLCDVQMPELDGHEVLKALRQNPLTATVPFIFLTSLDTKANFRQGMQLGADDYLSKPFTCAELLTAIATRLEKRTVISQPFTQALQQVEAKLNDLANYSEKLNSLSAEQMVQSASLRGALSRGEFQVYYQPQIDLTTGQICGSEALVRWQTAEQGTILPAEFIPLAEETGLIIPIGEQVLQTACSQATKWQATGDSPFRVAVNLSARQFAEPQLSQRIVQILQTTGLNPAHLELEVTESSLMENTAAAIATLNELKALGIHIAIDDFGTGYASFQYLKQFPFDTLKIDKSFVRNLTKDIQNTAITIAVIELARSLNLQVVAEGVETEADLAFLRQHGCDRIQGYLFSRPLPASEFEQLFIMSQPQPEDRRQKTEGRHNHWLSANRSSPLGIRQLAVSY